MLAILISETELVTNLYPILYSKSIWRDKLNLGLNIFSLTY